MSTKVSKASKPAPAPSAPSAPNAVMRALSSISPYENNPRINAQAVGAVAESLRAFGWQQPIVVDVDGVIIVGHTRYQAALSMGWTEGWIKVADNLTPSQAAAYRLADNRVGELADWDEEKLMAELAALDADEFDLSGLGFTDEELGRVSTQAKKDLRYLEDFEVMPKPKPKWILISAAEDECSAIMSAVNNLKLKTIKMEYSGEASSHEYNKGLKEKAK